MDVMSHQVGDGPITAVTKQKRKRNETADLPQKRRRGSSASSSDNDTHIDFANLNKKVNQAGPITNTESNKHAAHDEKAVGNSQEEDSGSSEIHSAVLGEERPGSVDVASSPPSSVGVTQQCGKKKKRQRAKRAYTAEKPSTSFIKAKPVHQADSSAEVKLVTQADESTEPPITLFPKAGDSPRRRCEETETLVLDWEEAMFTAEIPFDVMDGMLKLIGEDQWTGSGSKWLNKYGKITQLNELQHQNHPNGQLGQRLLHILDICSRYQHLHYAAEQIEFIGELNSSDDTVIAGQVHLIESLVLPAIRKARKVKKTQLVHHIIPLAVAAAWGIFLSGEDLEGPCIHHSMASLKVLRQLVGVILELTRLIGPNGDELARLCAVLTEDITKTMDNIGVQVINDRKAVAAEAAARAEATAREAAIKQRKAQFFASAEKFLESGHASRQYPAQPTVRGSRLASVLSTSASEASWWTA